MINFRFHIISLIAVFIPLLFMGGVVGRLFREFAMTVTATIVISAIVSLTLTPMMCAKLLKPEAEQHHGRLFRWSEHAYLLTPIDELDSSKLTDRVACLRDGLRDEPGADHT